MTIAEFFNKVGFKVNESDVKKVNNTISDIKSTATKVLGAIGIGFSMSALNGMVEEFSRVNDQIRNSTAALGEQSEIQQKILASASATRSSYQQSASVISNLVHENSELFGTIDEAVEFNNAATMLFKTAGKTNEEIAGLMEAINKSFAKGYVDSETISQLLERSPEAVELLNKKLGTTSDKLEEMASSRTMTVADLKAAFVENADEIEKKFGNVQYRISDALTVIRNKWGVWLADMDKTIGVTNGIGRFMVSAFDRVISVLNKARNAVVWLADKLGGMDKLLRLVGITAGILLVAFNFDKIKSGLSGIAKLLGSIKLSTLAIIAVAVMIALIVEDFINFMQGNDSLIGSLLEKAGIDTEKVRDTIIGAWNAIKGFLVSAWNTIKNVAKAVWDGLKAFWAEHGESIKAGLAAAWNAIKTVLLTVWNIIKTVATTIFNGLRAFWEKHGEQIKTAFSNIWQGIKNVVTVIWNVIKTIAETVFNALKAFWDTWGTTIIAVFTGIWNVIKAVFGTVFDVLADLFAAFSALFAGDWEGFWNNIKAFFSDLWNGLLNIVSTIITAIWNVISSIFTTIWEFLSGIVQKIWDTIVGAFTSVRDTIANIFNGIKETVSSVFNALVDIVKAPINGIIGFLNKLIDAMNSLSFDVPDWIPGIGGKKFGFNIPKIPALAQGGYVKANDPRLAVVGDNPTQGEIVAPEGKLLSIMTQALGSFAAKNSAGEIQAVSSILKSLSSYGNQNGGEYGKAVSGVLNVLDRFVSKMVPTKETGDANAITQNRSVVQNVEINNEFNGDTPVQQKASKAADKAAKDVTGELARGLAYAH